MRPKDMELREHYRTAAKKLREEGKLVTVANLGKLLNFSRNRVQNFFDKNENFKQELAIDSAYGERRMKYLRALEILQGCEKTITMSNLAQIMNCSRKTIQTFLTRDPGLATLIGLQLCNHSHNQQDYRKAIETIKARRHKVTARLISEELGVRTGTVFNFLKAHPNIKWSMVSRFRKGQEFTVQYFNKKLLRLVLDKVDAPTYVQLWDQGLLDFQRKGLPRPAHLPDRYEAETIC